jgi:hypothetical protein
MMPATFDLRPRSAVWNIFTPTPEQRRQSAWFRWMLTNCPDASTIGVRALVRRNPMTAADRVSGAFA